MLIRTLCRTCTGNGTHVAIHARADAQPPRHLTVGQTLTRRTCTDCDGTGHQPLTATDRIPPPRT
ncbi:hypothetical protein [Nocardiopsis algeriensis]|uniref:DnaJ-class molecular chaperone n=1 Tax=Nocardiopsis algeriensis TaxID=1478215 RepID=A0A841IM64_9ACTN|nr:hypothetical protein [Nocardiopsis algeriensis]MBB6119899.1 DnaJ-class molecular chaperone [Nocardiopsis algeriensis]